MSLSQFRAIIAFAALLGSVPAFAAEEFCSKLDFNGVVWSANIPTKHRTPFKLALNISGSFEGNEGWTNLANNFDGMGISLGLLNQNLGTGSLQPMFITMRNKYSGAMTKHFAQAHYTSLAAMLQTWQAGKSSGDVNQFLRSRGFSEYDEPEMIAEELQADPQELAYEMQLEADRNSISVMWAKQNLMGKSGGLKDDWAGELRSVSNSKEYRSIQVGEAEDLHGSAIAYFNYFHMTQLRSYLFFFDIVVQNGGLPDAVLVKYAKWLKSNSKAAEDTRLRKILELRLPYVRRQYRTDVQSRKLSIINGMGRVHKKSRNYKKEFCSDVMSNMP